VEHASRSSLIFISALPKPRRDESAATAGSLSPPVSPSRPKFGGSLFRAQEGVFSWDTERFCGAVTDGRGYLDEATRPGYRAVVVNRTERTSMAAPGASLAAMKSPPDPSKTQPSPNRSP